MMAALSSLLFKALLPLDFFINKERQNVFLFPKKNRYMLLFYFGIFCIASRVWEPQALITALPQKGFIDYTELLVPVLSLIPVSFILTDNYEIELGLVCGKKTTRLVFGSFFSIVSYQLISLVAIIVAYRYRAYTPINQEAIKIPIIIPEYYKLYMIISALVSILFFSSLYLLFRVATRNCYVPIGLGLLIYTVFNTFNYNIHNGFENIKNALFDPFISNYFIGDKVPIEYYRVGPLWTYNRLLFFGLAVVMLAVTYVLLRREKLHQGFHD